MSRSTRILQVGLGPIGVRMAQYVADRDGLELVAAVDPAPDKCGRTLGSLGPLSRHGEVVVLRSIAEAVAATRPDVAFVTTFSSLASAAPQIEELAARGIHVISTCEELSYPWLTQPTLAERIDAVARRGGACVLGTGVNPGFLMDLLPVVTSGICQSVSHVKLWRVQDASSRRVPFQQKIGAGLTLEEFETKKKLGTLRHVGLTESMHMISASFGWHLDRTEDILSPIVAEKEILSGYRPIHKGQAAGVQQIGRGFRDGKEVLTLTFRASVGEPEPADSVRIEGSPDVFLTVPGGINGDIATCAISVNAVGSVLRAGHGLKTMLDVPAVSYSTGPRTR